MAKKKKNKDPRLKLVAQYKKFVATNGKTPKSIDEFLSFGKLTFEAFKSHFRSLEELELAIILLYFKEADDMLHKDKHSKEWGPKDRHSAFLYMLIELADGDEVFLETFVAEKRKAPNFMGRLAVTMNAQSFHAFESSGKSINIFGPIDINPKRSALSHHALSVLWFFAADQSHDKEDSDAFIEKTTDLLFRLTDTSTLNSIFDLGKFLVTRKDTAFSWS